MKNFKELKIWQKGMRIANDCYKLVAQFPNQEKFGLCTQITRSAVSIPSNIAEGSSRRSEKEYCRYIEISLGSAFELETQLLIAHELNYGDAALRSRILSDVWEEQKMLVKFMSSLACS